LLRGTGAPPRPHGSTYQGATGSAFVPELTDAPPRVPAKRYGLLLDVGGAYADPG
jgi:hypothetical protein